MAHLSESRHFTPSSTEISGRLLIGNSPIFSDGWSGVLRGVAVYDTALDSEQIARHYATWTSRQAPALTSDDSCIALYLFNEHAGRVVHNRVRSENDLYIPPNSRCSGRPCWTPCGGHLSGPADSGKMHSSMSAGFIPFGCFFCAYFSARRTTLARPSRLSSGRRHQRFHRTYSSVIADARFQHVRFDQQYSWICSGSRGISRSGRASVRSRNVLDRAVR